MIPYLDTQEKKQSGGLPLNESVMFKITEYVKSKEYNACCDNFFVSLLLLKNFLKTSCLFIVGTITKTCRDLAAVKTELRKGFLLTSQFFRIKIVGQCW